MGHKKRSDNIVRLLATLKSVLPNADEAYGNTSTPPNPGCSESLLCKAEAHLGRPLPTDYRSFLKEHNGWSQMCQFEWFPVEKLLDEKWQTFMSEDTNNPGIEKGVWIGRSLDDDLGFYLRRTGGHWELLWVSQGNYNQPMTFSEVIDNLLTDFVEQAEWVRAQRPRP